MAVSKRQMKTAHHVKDLDLAPKGHGRIEWAARSMPVLASIQERFRKQKPLKGLRVSACLHVTTETAHLMQTLQAGGADITLCASNPLSRREGLAGAWGGGAPPPPPRRGRNEKPSPNPTGAAPPP